MALLKQHGVSPMGMSFEITLQRYSLRCGEWCEEFHFWVGSLDRSSEYRSAGRSDPSAALGDRGDRFYLIVDGVARTTNAQGQELSTSGPGGFVGEIAILTDRPRTATVTAATDINALSLSKADFESVMQASPDLRRDFDAVVAERLARG